MQYKIEPKSMRKKRALTLLEVVVALGLTAILLGTLFTFYRQLFQTRAELQKGKEIVFQRVFLHERLTQLFGRILSEEEGALFYTAPLTEGGDPVPEGSFGQHVGEALYFYYDNGIDPDPAYCHQVSGMLYLSKERQLRLCTFPDRVEVLMEDLPALEMRFFNVQSKQWQKGWAQEESRLPPMVKLVIGGKEELDYLFFLPHAYRKIDYKIKK